MSGDRNLSHPPSSNVMVLCSSFALSSAELALLERGLNFIPTPTVFDKTLLRKDLYDYHRRLKILDHFNFNQNRTVVPFKNPSTWEPNESLISPTFQALISNDIVAFNSFRVPTASVRHNITKEQRIALSSLRKLDNIIIKPADKGGQIVLQDRISYLLEANRQLQDTKYYIEQSNSMQQDTQRLIHGLVQKLYDQKYISHKQLIYLYGPENPRPRLFYLLPKIHKPPESWTVPSKIPAGRPIVSDCGSESYRIAEFIDYYINPLSQSHASYVKDTYDFVGKLKQLQVPSNTLLFSIDVESLYTNIETDSGLRAIKLAFQQNPQDDRPDDIILELLKLTLTRNDFEFNGKFYLHILGCAMGRKFSPAYADIYMADWERSAFQKCTTLPLLYLRYLDDIFGLWVGTETSFLEFFSVLNEHHPSIKLKYNLQKERVEFLDTVVFFMPSRNGLTKNLATKVYFKPTDRHALLHRKSYHPQHTFKGLIKSPATLQRIKRRTYNVYR